MIKTVNVQEVLDIYSNETTITSAAKEYCRRHGITYTDSIRRRFSDLINANLNVSENSTDSNNYSNDNEKIRTLNALDTDGTVMSIDRYCEVHGLDRDSVRSYKLVSHTGIPYYNVVFYENRVEDITKDNSFLEELVKKYISPCNDFIEIEEPEGSLYVDRLILTDVHIGLDNTGNVNTTPIYKQPKYTSDEILRRVRETIKHVLAHKLSDELIIDNLGDFLDGLNGYTTRGGHKLPQLMSDKEAFDLGISFQVQLVELLLNNGYRKITLNSVIEDNHSHLFAYFVHTAVKNILETKYPDNVEYNIHNRFLSHYKVGVHTFILTHGKDSADMKFGMKLNLDEKIIAKIDSYCKEYKLYDGNLIELSKGDLHQHVVDYTSSVDFEYANYPSFAPPSNWVQVNFGNQKSGVVFQNVHKRKKLKTSTPLWF